MTMTIRLGLLFETSFGMPHATRDLPFFEAALGTMRELLAFYGIPF